MPATITITRPTYTDVDSLSASQFNGVAISSAVVPDATGASEGVIRLAGDLGGTAAAPEIGALKVTAAKLATDAVETAKVKDKAVTLAKLADIATDNLIGRSTAGSGVPELIPCTAAGRALLAAADAAAQRTALALVPGTDVQAYDADLAAIAALTTTAFGRSFLDRADAAAARTLCGIGSIATRAITITNAAASGGSDGDVHLQYV